MCEYERRYISKICFCALIYCLLRVCALKTNSKIIFLAFCSLEKKYQNMPFVEYDVKLDFKDVLFRPKRSSLKSRSQVQDLKKEDFFKIVFSGRVKKRIQIPELG